MTPQPDSDTPQQPKRLDDERARCLKRFEGWNDGLMEYMAYAPDGATLDLVSCQAVLEATLSYLRDSGRYAAMIHWQKLRDQEVARRLNLRPREQPRFDWWHS